MEDNKLSESTEDAWLVDFFNDRATVPVPLKAIPVRLVIVGKSAGEDKGVGKRKGRRESLRNGLEYHKFISYVKYLIVVMLVSRLLRRF